MPSLMPGTAGSKEIFGISVIRNENLVNIPPEAMKRYGIFHGERLILSKAHHDEPGFNLWIENRAKRTVLYRKVVNLRCDNSIQLIEGRAYSRTSASEGGIRLTP